MRRITMMQAQWQADTQSGESLRFTACKGGYFSTDDRYGLRVVGKTVQDGTPTPDAPVPIRCVKTGTTVRVHGKNLAPQAVESGLWGPDGLPYFSAFSTRVTEIPVPATSQWLTISSNLPIFRWVLLSDGAVVQSQLVDGSVTVCGVDTDTGAPNQTIKITLNGSASDFEWIQVEEGEDATAFFAPRDLSVPCDLYEGDIWYPATGKVERHRKLTALPPMQRTSSTGRVDGFHAFYGAGPTDRKWIDIPPILCTGLQGVRKGVYSVSDYPSLKGADDSDILFLKLPASALPEYTVEAANAYLAEKNMMILYELDAPVIEQYTPQPIPTRPGTVTVWQSPAEEPATLTATMPVRRGTCAYDGTVHA